MLWEDTWRIGTWDTKGSISIGGTSKVAYSTVYQGYKLGLKIPNYSNLIENKYKMVTNLKY